MKLNVVTGALLMVAPLSQVLEPLALDPLTVADDPTFLARLQAQPNLPDYVETGLPALY